MSKQKKQSKMGRPPILSWEEKKQIVDAYAVYYGESALRRFDRYTRLSAFAQERGIVVGPHIFSQDNALKEYMDSKKARMSPKEVNCAALPAWVPLDKTDISLKSRAELVDIMLAREEMFSDIYLRGAKAIESFASLSRSKDALHKSQSALQEERDSLLQQLHQLKADLRMARKEITELRSYIHQHVEPAIAEEYFRNSYTTESVSNPKEIIDTDVLGKTTYRSALSLISKK